MFDINDILKIDYKEQKNQTVQAAIIRCLNYPEENLSLFKRWFEKELPQNIPDKDRIIQERVECALRCRKKLELFDTSLQEEQVKKRECIEILSRLIMAKYSGKSQSYISKTIPELGGSIDLSLERIVNAIKNEKELIFLFCFGGYKNHRCPTFPEVDWAEFFQLKFFIEYLFPIIKSYKYGVLIQYESEDVIIESNNVPRESLDAYCKSFEKLLDFFKTMLKKQFDIDLKIELIRCRNQYDVEELFTRMETKREEIINSYNSLSKEEQELWLKRAENNIMWENGTKEYCELSLEEKRQIIYDARIANECFLAADYDLRGESFFDRDNCIPFVGTWGYNPSASAIDLWFHIKSSLSSSVDFWIGTGIISLETINGKEEYKERIVSPTQYEKLMVHLDEYNVNFPELSKISKNFKKIMIFKGKFPY